ncbi:tellurite resistance TerB family protein [Nonlabens ponticola]|uniref:TerB family tellurite resistance protein n=1 Tax=Nonlabens ponticola TaxID=2496866 RepID=A0A3S9MZD4_9FLAO|nr:TerB family tellurite resistance protein [Nonlabens ponticola]AZQ44540.1 TerB family tellurite resistance protein [Nonlabens ponticola]
MMNYTEKEKEDILVELIKMAHADAHLKKEEIEFIKALGKRLGIDDDQVLQMIEHPETGKISPPKSFTQRIVHFHRLMLMMHIDGVVDDGELQFLHEVALKYGIRQSTVAMLLAKMKQYPHGDIPPTELLSIHTQTSN